MTHTISTPNYNYSREETPIDPEPETEEQALARLVARARETEVNHIRFACEALETAMGYMSDIYGPPAEAFIKKLRDNATELEQRPTPPQRITPPPPVVDVNARRRIRTA